MEKKVSCDCGATIQKKDEDALVAAVQQHAKEVHHMDMSRDDILAMAEIVRPS